MIDTTTSTVIAYVASGGSTGALVAFAEVTDLGPVGTTVAGVLLGTLIVPCVRWWMQRTDRLDVAKIDSAKNQEIANQAREQRREDREEERSKQLQIQTGLLHQIAACLEDLITKQDRVEQLLMKQSSKPT